MDDTTRRLLTEVLGEYYCHPDNCNINCSRYKKAKLGIVCTDPIRNRPFTGPDDAQVVKDKMVEKGEWEEFVVFCMDRYTKKDPGIFTFWAWLFSYYTDSQGNRTGYRLCELAGEFVKKGDGR